MTFIEAALEILRREGVPLHAKIIAEKSVSAELLSHVGKTPVQTMSKRISATMAKGKGPFVRVKPGVFALAAWKDEKGVLTPPGKPRSTGEENRRPASGHNADFGREPMSAPRAEATAQSVSAPVAAPHPPSETPVRADDAEAGEGNGARSRRSRNRRSRNRSRDRDVRDVRHGERRPGEDDNGDVRGTTDGSRPEKAPDDSPAAEKRMESQAPGRRDDNRRPAPRDEAPRNDANGNGGKRPSSPPGDRGRDERSSGLALEVEHLLAKQNQPQSGRAIAERLHISGINAEIIVDALLDADNRDRRSNGRRPLFIRRKSGWTLVAREIPQEVVQLEEDIFLCAGRLEQIAERQIQRRLKSLSAGKLTQLIILVLRQMGYSDVEPIARGKGSECHLRVTDRRQGGRFSTAVVIRNDTQGRGVNDADVTALRGSMHHYRASRGLIVTTGEVLPEGVREADIPNLPPVGFIDGRMLAQEFVRCGIGVEKRLVPLVFLDESQL